MKRTLSIVLALLVGLVLAVPAAQATRSEPPVRYRFFQDVSIPRSNFLVESSSACASSGTVMGSSRREWQSATACRPE